VQTALVDNPALLAGWDASKRVQRLPGRRRAPATTVAALSEATASAIPEVTASATSEATAAASPSGRDDAADPRTRSVVSAVDQGDQQQPLLRRDGHAARRRSIAVYQLMPSRLTRFADGRLRSLFGSRTVEHSERRE
jgi:hypothetical protein